MKQIAVLGDIHGCYKTLLALIEKLPQDTEVVFCGDLQDRGPLSADVIEFVRTGGYKCVLGNHESLERFMEPLNKTYVQLHSQYGVITFKRSMSQIEPMRWSAGYDLQEYLDAVRAFREKYESSDT